MHDDLRGRVVVITGASSGTGRATAHAFAREGAQLVLAARREAMLHVAADECRQLGRTAKPDSSAHATSKFALRGFSGGLLPTPMPRVNGRLLHRGFLAPQPSLPTPGSGFEPMHDDQAVRGGCRHGFNHGGVPLLATALVGAAGLIGWLAWRRRALD